MLGKKDDLSITIDGDARDLERALASADAATRRAERGALDYDLSLRKLEVDNMRLARSLDDMAKKKLAAQNKAFRTAGRGMVYFGGAIAAGLFLAAKASANYNAEMAQVQSLTRANAKEMDALRQATRDPGFVEIGASATDAANAEVELVKAGVGVKDIVGGALPGALALAAAGQMDYGDATEIASSAMVQFGLKGKDIPHLADLLAAGADKALGSVGDLGDGLKYVGTIAHQAGLTVEDTVGVLAEFASAGLKGEMGGTAFRQMLLKLQAPSNKARELMDTYGISLYDAQGQMKTMPEIAGTLQQALHHLTPATRNQALATIFGARAVQAANILYAQGAKGTQDWIDKVNQSGFAMDQARGKMDSLSGDAAKLKAALTDVGISTGDQLQSPLREVTQDLTGMLEAFNSLPDPVKHYVALLASATAAVTLLGGAGLLTVVKMRELKDTFPGMSKRLSEMSKGGIAARAGMFALGVGLQDLAGHVGQTHKELGQLVSIAGDAAMGFAVGGPWGAAIGGGIGLLKALSDDINGTSATFHDLTLEVDANTMALTDNSKQQVENALLQSGALDAAKQLGISIGLVTQAALGNKDILAAVNGQLDDLIKKGTTATVGGPVLSEQAMSAVDLQKALGGANDKIAETRHNQRLLNQANQDGAGAEQDLGTETDQTTQYLDAQTVALNKLRHAADRALTVFEGRTSLRQAMIDARKAAHDMSGDLDKGGQKAVDARKKLGELAGTWNDLPDKVQNAKGAYRDFEKQLIGTATAMGWGEKAAKKLVDRLLEVPSRVDTSVNLDVGDALAKLRNLQGWYSHLPHRIITKVITDQITVHNRWDSAFDSRVPGSADGSIVPGPRYPYGDKVLRRVAPGEAIVSNRYGQVDRNRPLIDAIQADRPGRGPIMPPGGARPGGGTTRVVVQQALPGKVQLVLDGHVFDSRVRQVASDQYITERNYDHESGGY